MPIDLFRALIPVTLLCTASASGQSLKIGEAAPPLRLERTIPIGANATWTALQGKPVVVEFWATWCGNCVEEISHLNALAADFSNIQFLSITDEPAGVVEPFLAKQPIRGVVGLDRDGASFKAFGVEARPQTIMIDRDGIVRGIMHPAQVDAAVLADLTAGRPIRPYHLPARLRILQDQDADPVFALMLRPSNRPKPGGVFAVDPGKLEGNNIFLKTILAYAYSTGERHIEGPDELLRKCYDFCVLLPEGRTGDTELLRDMLEHAFRLKVRHETRETDAVVLTLPGGKPAEFSGGFPISTLVRSLEYRLNRFVCDQTGLTGRYRHIELPEKNEEIPMALAQTGIGFAYAKCPVDILIVESLEVPEFRVSLPGR